MWPILFVLAIVFTSLFFITFAYKCKPHCDGAFWGEKSNDGCGGKCSCKEGGLEKENGICCYPNCNGLYCGDDGCGGTCSCNAIPNGKCNNGRCCYAQPQDNINCGDDGCGGTRICASGATCSPSGVCVSSGTTGWSYNILKTKGVQRTQTSNAAECAGWLPKNTNLDLLNFPCKSDTDCPIGDKCSKDSNGNSFCQRNNIYQYWIYDPLDPSGYNCTKILAGSTVCGVPKASATAFNISGNIGPDKEPCGQSCTINPICPPSGPNSCCPQNWVQNNGYCLDVSGKTMCCLNNPINGTSFQKCISEGHVACETLPNTWWKGNLAEITNGICGNQVSGPSLAITRETLRSKPFTDPCKDKYSDATCNYDNNGTKFTGTCQPCLDGNLICLPERVCQATYESAGAGTCSNGNLC